MNNINERGLYYKNKIIKIGYVSNEGSQSGSVYSIEGISPTVCACTHGYVIGNIIVSEMLREIDMISENKCIQIGNVNSSYEQSGRVYSCEGISPTVMGNSHGKTTGGYNAPKIIS